MDAGRRHKTLGSETKDSLILTATKEAQIISIFASVPWAPILTDWCKEGQVTPSRQWVVLQERSLMYIGNLDLSQWAVNIYALCSGGRHYLYYTELMTPPNKFLMILLYQKPYVKCQVHHSWYLLFKLWGPLDSTAKDMLLSSWGCKVCYLWVIQAWLNPFLRRSILLWGNCRLLLKKHLIILPRFILRAREVFQDNNTDHKKLCTFLWVCLSLFSGSSSTIVKPIRTKRTQFSWESFLGEISLQKAKGHFYQQGLITKKLWDIYCHLQVDWRLAWWQSMSHLMGQLLPVFLNKYYAPFLLLSWAY